MTTPDGQFALPDDPAERIDMRREMALSLRNARWTYAQIAAQLTKRGLPCSAQTVRLDVQHQRLAIATSDSIEELLGEQRGVVLDLQKALYPKMMAGNEKAAAVVLKGLEHIAKLRALYAPQRVDIGVSDTEYAEQLVQVLSVIRPDTLKELLRGNRQAYEAIIATLGPEVIEGEVAPALGLGGAAPAVPPGAGGSGRGPGDSAHRPAGHGGGDQHDADRELATGPGANDAGRPDAATGSRHTGAPLPGHPGSGDLDGAELRAAAERADHGPDHQPGSQQANAVAASLDPDTGLYDDGDGWSNL